VVFNANHATDEVKTSTMSKLPHRCPKNLDDVQNYLNDALKTSTMSKLPQRCPKNLGDDDGRARCVQIFS